MVSFGALSCRYLDRKSTRLNSSHRCISYAVFCLKKLDQSQRERRTVDRHVDFGEQMGHGPEVVRVAGGQNHRSPLRLVFLEESQVVFNERAAAEFGVGAHHSAIAY